MVWEYSERKLKMAAQIQVALQCSMVELSKKYLCIK